MNEASLPAVPASITVTCPVCRGDRTVTHGTDPDHSYESTCATCAGMGYIWTETAKEPQ